MALAVQELNSGRRRINGGPFRQYQTKGRFVAAKAYSHYAVQSFLVTCSEYCAISATGTIMLNQPAPAPTGSAGVELVPQDGAKVVERVGISVCSQSMPH
jgi:hypothetical protein